MAEPSISVVDTLRKTADALRNSQDYQWGHMGACNCGFLARQVTHADRARIHRAAMQRCGDWTEQLYDYCSTSGLEMDALISALVDAGFSIDDLAHLERLSDPEVLRSLPPEHRNLRHNVKSDVVVYLLGWASLLEFKLLGEIHLPEFVASPVDIETEYNPSV